MVFAKTQWTRRCLLYLWTEITNFFSTEVWCAVSISMQFLPCRGFNRLNGWSENKDDFRRFNIKKIKKKKKKSCVFVSPSCAAAASPPQTEAQLRCWAVTGSYLQAPPPPGIEIPAPCSCMRGQQVTTRGIVGLGSARFKMIFFLSTVSQRE